MKDNKIIAEFMGGIISSVPNLINLPQTRGDANIHSVKGSEMLPNGTYSVHRLNELKYHTSWDWLMPVVYKILWLDTSLKEISDTLEEDYKDESYEDIHNGLTNALLSQTNEAVVEFIKQYNNKK